VLAPRFAVTRMLGLRHGRRLARWERRHGSIVDAQLAAPPSRWSSELRREVEQVRAADFLVGPDDVNGSLDLVAVAVRRP